MVEILINIELNAGFDQYGTTYRVSPILITSIFIDLTVLADAPVIVIGSKTVSNIENDLNFRNQLKCYLENIYNF